MTVSEVLLTVSEVLIVLFCNFCGIALHHRQHDSVIGSPFARDFRGRPYQIVGHLPQFVCHFHRLHQTGIREDKVQVWQLLQYAPQGRNLQFRSRVGIVAVLVVVYTEGFPLGYPSACMRP